MVRLHFHNGEGASSLGKLSGHEGQGAGKCSGDYHFFRSDLSVSVRCEFALSLDIVTTVYNYILQCQPSCRDRCT
jgi:hypothetical protein